MTIAGTYRPAFGSKRLHRLRARAGKQRSEEGKKGEEFCAGGSSRHGPLSCPPPVVWDVQRSDGMLGSSSATKTSLNDDPSGFPNQVAHAD